MVDVGAHLDFGDAGAGDVGLAPGQLDLGLRALLVGVAAAPLRPLAVVDAGAALGLRQAFARARGGRGPADARLCLSALLLGKAAGPVLPGAVVAAGPRACLRFAVLVLDGERRPARDRLRLHALREGVAPAPRAPVNNDLASISRRMQPRCRQCNPLS